jgi:hypothetical protein
MHTYHYLPPTTPYPFLYMFYSQHDVLFRLELTPTLERKKIPGTLFSEVSSREALLRFVAVRGR